MSFLSIRRRKLTCFYCTHQVAIDNLPTGSAQNYSNGRPRRFTCPNCSADNHLDENGDILDYIPDTPARPAPVFARRRNSPRAIHSLTQQRASTPDSPPPTQTFCRTCAHNQKFVADAIAAYPLPPENHPDYDEHINVLFPRHKRILEGRWPPVCTDCAPKVNERIRTSNYQVKVASLGQMLARTSGYEAAAVGGKQDLRKGSVKKSFECVVWWVRGGVWCYFHILTLVWHGSAMLLPDGVQDMELDLASWGGCIIRSIVGGEIDSHCYGISAHQAARFLPWSFFGIFWIYHERGLQNNPHKKLVGAKEYLRLELGIFGFRMLCWYFVAPGGISFSEETFSRLHLGLFFLSLMSSLFSITCLKLEDPPSFSLREPEPIPGTPSPPTSPPPRRAPTPRHPMSPTTPLRPSLNKPPPSTGSTFYSPVKRIRAPSPTPAPRRGTPAKETLSPDAMDWNPTDSQETTSRWQTQMQRLPPPPPQPSFTPSFNNAQAQRQNQYIRSASPFSGSLPPAPRPPAQRIVSSLFNQPQKQQTPSNQLVREQFFTHRVNQASPVPTGAEYSKVSATGYRLGSPQYAPMAPQRFFVDDEATGLETLMAGGFKLEDEPEIVSEKVAEESWAYVGVRVVGLFGCIGGIVWFAPSGGMAVHICASATLVLVCWREGVMTSALSSTQENKTVLHLLEPGVLMVLFLAAFLQRDNASYISRLRKAALASVIYALTREFWGMLMRMQRSRARKFYEDERKRSIEEEKEGRRKEERRKEREESTDSGRGRSGSAPLLRREGSMRSSFGGLGL